MTDLTPHDYQPYTPAEAAAEQAAETAALLERAVQTAIAELDKAEHCAGVATGSVRDHDIRVAVEAAAVVLLRDRDTTIRQQSAAIESVTREHARLAADRDRAVAAIIVAQAHAAYESAAYRILAHYQDGGDDGRIVDDYMADGRIEPGPWRWAELAVTGKAAATQPTTEEQP